MAEHGEVGITTEKRPNGSALFLRIRFVPDAELAAEAAKAQRELEEHLGIRRI